MSNVLITAIGSFSADIVIKNLKQEGNYIVGCDIYPSVWIAQSVCVDSFYQVSQAIHKLNYIREILHICEKESIRYIIPLTDVEVDVLSRERECFESKGICICISSRHAVEICRNKWECYKYLQKCGFSNLIPTREMTESIEDWTYPLIAKPIYGRSSQGVIRLFDQKDYLYHAGKVNKYEYIIQPCLDGNVITVDVISDGKKVCAIPRRELLRTLNGAGTSVQVFHSEKIMDLCLDIVRILGMEGCANIEFLEEQDTYYFLECNPRFSGGVAFSCAAGYNFITNHLKYFRTGNIGDATGYKDMFIARKYKEYVLYE